MALLGRHKEQVKQRQQQPIRSRDWLDSEGRFLCGKYGPKDGNPGQYAEFVAVKDFRYIMWILEFVDNVSEEDRNILRTLLKYKSRNESEDD